MGGATKGEKVMFGKYETAKMRKELAILEERVDSLCMKMERVEQKREQRQQRPKDISEMVAKQLTKNRRIENAEKLLDIHHGCCPECGGDMFLEYALKIVHNRWAGGSNYLEINYANNHIANLKYSYETPIDVRILELIAKRDGRESFPLYRCICGHEWMELPKKKEVG